ncbi:MAG: hypothetical protein IKR25_03975, partial [Muribaculaceae bacterium]|nr:hypothetical protein [Muribaculaceae bacterium]
GDACWVTHVLAGWPRGVIPIVNGEIASGEPHRDAALHASSLKISEEAKLVERYRVKNTIDITLPFNANTMVLVCPSLIT